MAGLGLRWAACLLAALLGICFPVGANRIIGFDGHEHPYASQHHHHSKAHVNEAESRNAVAASMPHKRHVHMLNHGVHHAEGPGNATTAAANKALASAKETLAAGTEEKAPQILRVGQCMKKGHLKQGLSAPYKKSCGTFMEHWCSAPSQKADGKSKKKKVRSCVQFLKSFSKDEAEPKKEAEKEAKKEGDAEPEDAKEEEAAAAGPASVVPASPSPMGDDDMGPAPGPAPAAEGSLPEDGFSGPLVKHEDMVTKTDDWHKEYGPKAKGEQSYREICKKYPDNSWCRAYGHHQKSKSLRMKSFASSRHGSSAILMAVAVAATGAALTA